MSTTTHTTHTTHITDTSAEATPASRGRSEISPRLAAKIAGGGYVALFALAIFANFFVREGLIVSGDSAATAANIAESEGLFRLGLVSFMAVFVIDVVVAWALYIVFRRANRDLSLVAAWFRVVYTVFLGVALVFFFQALQLLGDSDFLAVIGSEQREAQALVALDTFNSAWLIGLVAFGIHLILLGYLIARSGAAPRVLGWVMIVAGMAYVVDTVAHSLLSNYVDYEGLFLALVVVPSVIGEGWFGLWLLAKGGKDQNADATSDLLVGTH